MPRALLVTGLGYGDEGKGSIVDFLTRETGCTLVVRHNGGAQAAHNVVTAEGRHHTFAQWGSGTFAGARTFLSKHMIVHPLAMLNEAEHLEAVGVSDPWGSVTVDERALVTTLYHQTANRIREDRRGEDRHGSCGMGIGEAYEDRIGGVALRFGDLGDMARVEATLRIVRENKRRLLYPGCDESFVRVLSDDEILRSCAERMHRAHGRVTVSRSSDESDILRSANTVIFEGAQGVLLDQFRGVQPYTTWSNTTSENAREMLTGLGFDVTKVGVLRAYVTRHGAGPLASYDRNLTERLQDSHNRLNPWQGPFRCGWFDVDLARHAIEIEGGIDQLALTNVDRFESVAPGWIHVGPEARPVDHVVSAVGRHLRRVDIVSRGPTAADKVRILASDETSRPVKARETVRAGR